MFKRLNHFFNIFLDKIAKLLDYTDMGKDINQGINSFNGHDEFGDKDKYKRMLIEEENEKEIKK